MYTEKERKPVCRCSQCHHVILFCTRDTPCPHCGNTIFTVEYTTRTKES